MEKIELKLGNESTMVSIAHPYRWGDDETPAPPMFLPSNGDYFAYDEADYGFMTADEVRNKLYRDALKTLAPGKTVVDIGTGRDMNWALTALDAGASHVYAIEALEETVGKCQSLIQSRGLSDKVTLLKGMSHEVSLPEKVDICVTETIGNIATSEGILTVLKDAKRRFLKPNGACIPCNVSSFISAYHMPDHLRNNLGLTNAVMPWVRLAFENIGKFFDMRMALWEGQPNLTTTAEFENFDFSKDFEINSTNIVELEVVQNGLFDGFLVWTAFSCLPNGEVVDTIKQDTQWWPTYFPVFDDGVPVEAGDSIRVTCKVFHESHEYLPDYLVEGTIHKKDNSLPFKYSAPYIDSFRKNEFYKKMFPRV